MSDTAAGEDVADLADAFYDDAGFRNGIEHRARGHHRVVVPAGSAGELSILPVEWPRDDTTDGVLVAVPPRDLADFIEPLERNDLLVRSNLHDGIG